MAANLFVTRKKIVTEAVTGQIYKFSDFRVKLKKGTILEVQGDGISYKVTRQPGDHVDPPSA